MDSTESSNSHIYVPCLYFKKSLQKDHLSCHKPHCSLDDDSGHDHERWGQLPLEKVPITLSLIDSLTQQILLSTTKHQELI